MTTVDEAAGNFSGQLKAQLAAGVKLLSGDQTITFTLYKKVVLPLDGFVFWINCDLPHPSIGDEPAPRAHIQGSLHYSTEVEQEESSSLDINTIVFTALAQCDLFNEIDSQYLYIANYSGIRFSFNSQGKFYEQAGLWHYVGIAITAVMETQIIDDLAQLPSEQIVSNSLPIWLAMPTYEPPYPGFTCPFKYMFPSFLVPNNETPPYASVHIEKTTALVETATLGPRLQSNQLASEIVRVTTYGADNEEIITFLNFVIQYSYDWNYIGMMNMPIIVDEKQTQSELRVIAQKKTIEFKVSYLQNTVRDVARQHILKVKVKNEADMSHPVKTLVGAT